MKYDSNILQYFTNPTWAKVDTFYFTDDHLEDNPSPQQAFTRPEDAQNHTQNLKSKKVTVITRLEAGAELEAKTGFTPAGTPIELAGKALADANLELEAANKAKAELAADATGPEKAKATQRVNKAVKAVEAAQAALDGLGSGE